MIARMVVLLMLVCMGGAAFAAETRSARPQARKDTPAEKTVVYFFWGKGCPHCAQEETFLDTLKKKYR
jgi:thiol-disulfide isomerase/thioredoxin